MAHKQIAILYHGGCPDGFGGAYSAYKKFGDTADYIPVKHGKPVPEHLDGKDLYLIDFCYAQDKMDQLKAVAKSITVLDHHEGVRAVATQFPGLFDTSRSGTTIAWNYFHPDTPTPTLLRYVQDGDLYTFVLPDARKVLAYVYTRTDSFASFSTHNVEKWDAFARELETPEGFAHAVEVGTYFQENHNHVVEHGVHHAELVRFEGYECYLSGSSGEFTSDTGNRLANLKPPFAMVVSADAEGIRVSLRASTDEVNVATLAQKYGGNGHPRAAGFTLPYGAPIPWVKIQEHANPSD